MTRCYFTKAGYNRGADKLQGDNVWQAVCRVWSVGHVAIFSQQWCWRLIADSRSIRKHRLVKHSILAVSLLVPSLQLHMHGSYLASWYDTPWSYKYPWSRHHKNTQIWDKSTRTYAPEFTVSQLICSHTTECYQKIHVFISTPWK